MVLFIVAERTVAEWKQCSEGAPEIQQPLVVSISTTDTFDEGIEDRTILEFHCVPVGTVTTDSGETKWACHPTDNKVDVRPTYRRYPGVFSEPI